MAVSWRAWAPPLDPPTEGGLDLATAEAIAAEFWTADPWLCMALIWEAYALTLPATAGVSAISTGVQSVSYRGPQDPWALAMARAQWFRDQRGSLVSVPLTLAPPAGDQWPVDWWQRNLEDPATWDVP